MVPVHYHFDIFLPCSDSHLLAKVSLVFQRERLAPVRINQLILSISLMYISGGISQAYSPSSLTLLFSVDRSISSQKEL